jgi:MFS family permease
MLVFFIPLAEVAMIANGLRGIGWAAINTGGYTLLANIAPAKRRAEASGYYSGVQAGMSTLFPAVSLWLIEAPLGGFRVVMALSAGFALAGGIASLILGRLSIVGSGTPVANDPIPARFNPFAMIEREVFLPSILLLCLNLTYPAVTAFLVLYAKTVGIQNFAWYFVASGATSLLARPVLGRLSDKIGCGPSIVAGFLLEICALSLLALSPGFALVLVCGVLFSTGTSIGQSTILAFAIQRANPQHRGRAMASFSMAYPLAAGVGALWAGSAVELAGYPAMYMIGVGLASAGLLVTLLSWPNLRSK